MVFDFSGSRTLSFYVIKVVISNMSISKFIRQLPVFARATRGTNTKLMILSRVFLQLICPIKQISAAKSVPTLRHTSKLKSNLAAGIY